MATLYGTFSAESSGSSGLADRWWLIDIDSPTQSIAIRVAPEPEESKDLGSVALQPAGGDGRFYVLNGPVKGGWVGENMTVFSLDASEDAALSSLLESRRKLLLKRNITDKMTYIRVVGPIRRRQTRASSGGAMRTAFNYTFSYVEVAE